MKYRKLIALLIVHSYCIKTAESLVYQLPIEQPHDTGPLMSKEQRAMLAKQILERLPNSPLALEILRKLNQKKS